MSKGFGSTYRIVLLAGGLFVCFAALGVRLVFLHVIDRENLLATVEKARRQTIVEQARRGDILDRNGAVLATSRSMTIVGVDPSSVIDTPAERQKWAQLATLLNIPFRELEKTFTTRFRAPAPTTPAPAASPATERANLVFNFNGAKTPDASA